MSRSGQIYLITISSRLKNNNSTAVCFYTSIVGLTDSHQWFDLTRQRDVAVISRNQQLTLTWLCKWQTTNLLWLLFSCSCLGFRLHIWFSVFTLFHLYHKEISPVYFADRFTSQFRFTLFCNTDSTPIFWRSIRLRLVSDVRFRTLLRETSKRLWIFWFEWFSASQCALCMVTSAFILRGRVYIRRCTGSYCSLPRTVKMNAEMMTFYTRCLQELTRIAVNDICRIARLSPVTPLSKTERVYAFQVTQTTLRVSIIILLSIISKSSSWGCIMLHDFYANF